VLAATALLLLVGIGAVVARRRAAAKATFASCRACGGDGRCPPDELRRGEWRGGGGPYNLQLYDSPRYYPYYEGRDYAAAWDHAGRCSVFCSASEDGGCALSCR
jgi:hypothetical protein